MYFGHDGGGGGGECFHGDRKLLRYIFSLEERLLFLLKQSECPQKHGGYSRLRAQLVSSLWKMLPVADPAKVFTPPPFLHINCVFSPLAFFLLIFVVYDVSKEVSKTSTEVFGVLKLKQILDRNAQKYHPFKTEHCFCVFYK